MSSAATTALSRQPLTSALRNITDPGDIRGVCHSLFTVLSLAVTGVLAGCRSLTAIWEHTTDLTATDLEALGLGVVGHEVVVMGCWGSGAWAVRMGGAESSFRQEKAPLP